MMSTATVIASIRCRKCSNTARRIVPIDVASMSWIDRQVRCPHDNALLLVWTTSTGDALHGGR